MSLSSLFGLGGGAQDLAGAPPAVGQPNNLIDIGDGPPDPKATRWAGYGLAGFALALGMFDIVRPSVMAAALLLTVPLAVLAIVLSSPQSFETSRWGRRSINGALVLPFMAMFMVNIFHAQIDPWWPLAPGGIGAVIAFGLALNARTRPGLASPWTMVAFITACGAAYGYGAVAVADIQFDSSAGQVIPVQILGKHESHGSRSSSYRLDLPAWGPRAAPNSVEVSSSTYNALPVGDDVCIVLHPGALTLPWFTAGACATPTP